MDRARTLGLFFSSFLLGGSVTTTTRSLVSSDTLVWDMRPSPSMTIPGPRKMIEPQFVYVPYIRVMTPEGEIEEEHGRWYHDVISPSEAEQLGLEKMDCEQAKKAIYAFSDEQKANWKDDNEKKAVGDNTV